MAPKKRSTGESALAAATTTYQQRLQAKQLEIKKKEEDIAAQQLVVESPVRLYIHAIAILLSGFYYGFALASFSTFMKPFIPHYLDMPRADPLFDTTAVHAMKWASSSFLFGCTATCAVGPILVHFLGTRNLTYANIIFFVLVNAFMAFGRTRKPLLTLFIVRFLTGLSVYLWTIISPLYMKATVPIKVYTNVMSAFNSTIAAGLAIGYLIGRESIAAHWRYLFGVLCVLEGIRLLILLMTPTNDPAWLSKRGADAATLAQCFRRFHSPTVAANIGQMLLDKHLLSNNLEAWKRAEIIKVAGPIATISLVPDFLTADFNFQFGLGLILSLLNQLTGMNIITIFSDAIFEAGGIKEPSAWSAAMGLISSLGTLVPIFGIRAVGKRALMLWGLWGQSLGLCIFLSGLAFKNTKVVFGGVCFAMIFYNLSLGGILFDYIGDFVPKNGIFVAALIQLLLNCTFAFTITSLQQLLTINGVFLAAQLFAVAGAVLFMLVGVETTGKTPTAIKEEFLRMKKTWIPFS